MNKNKLKPLLPSLREKKRYLAFEVISEEKIPEMEVEEIILNSVKEYLGTLHMGKAGIMFLRNRYNKDKQKGIIKVNNKYLEHLRASIALVDKPNMLIRSTDASGILKKLII